LVHIDQPLGSPGRAKSVIQIQRPLDRVLGICQILLLGRMSIVDPQSIGIRQTAVSFCIVGIFVNSLLKIA